MARKKGRIMKKLRNLENLEPEKRAALEAMLNLPKDELIPLKTQPITVQNPDDLEPIIEAGVLALTIGELLEQARTERGVGVRELARRLSLHHARVKQLEGIGQNGNIEIQTLARQARALAYRVRIILEPEEGGQSLEAQLV
jgi:DNA-binding Xre family transcriptional regulator